MDEAPSPESRWTRRVFLAAGAAPAAWAARGQESPGEAKKFLDAATEFEILRVTDLAHNSWLPLASNRAFTRKGDALVFASDASGTPQIYRFDVKPNKLRQLTEAAALNTNSFTLLPADRGIMYIDGRKVLQLIGARDRLVLELPEAWSQSPRIAISEDGATVVVSSSNGTRTRIAIAGRTTSVLEERDGDIGTLCIRPRQSAISFLSGGSLCLLPFSGQKAVPLKTAAGEVLSSLWSADGSALIYLLKPGKGGLTEIREFSPESGRDALVAKTSQFVHFQRNADASVFLGASGSVASPHLLFLVRAVKRELTLCEHRCSDARLSRSILAPNGSRIAFQTDRHGKLVIYSMAVDRLIEQSEEQTEPRSGKN